MNLFILWEVEKMTFIQNIEEFAQTYGSDFIQIAIAWGLSIIIFASLII